MAAEQKQNEIETTPDVEPTTQTTEEKLTEEAAAEKKETNQTENEKKKNTSGPSLERQSITNNWTNLGKFIKYANNFIGKVQKLKFDVKELKLDASLLPNILKLLVNTLLKIFQLLVGVTIGSAMVFGGFGNMINSIVQPIKYLYRTHQEQAQITAENDTTKQQELDNKSAEESADRTSAEGALKAAANEYDNNQNENENDLNWERGEDPNDTVIQGAQDWMQKSCNNDIKPKSESKTEPESATATTPSM